MDLLPKSPETLLTIVLAFLLLFCGLTAMAIGWFVTKNPDFFRKRCGFLPKNQKCQKKNQDKGSGCSLCNPNKEESLPNGTDKEKKL